ncbi:hypothetical protein BH09SUM1_BH09SUM1_03910 [soil metagenome]
MTSSLNAYETLPQIHRNFQFVSCSLGFLDSPITTDEAIGDATGDGVSDYFVRTGDSLKFVRGSLDPYSGTVTTVTLATNMPMNSMPPVGIGDLDGDGKVDFLLEISSLDNGGYRSYTALGRDLSGIANTQISPGNLLLKNASPAGDFNGDGVPDSVGEALDDSSGSTGLIQLIERNNPHLSGVYYSYAKANAAPLRGVGEVPGGAIYPPDARAWLGFADGDGPSLQAVTLHRNLDGVSNLPANMKPAFVHWGITTERAKYTQANLALKYVDREISGLDEDNLVLLESSTGSAGPWYIVDNATFEKDRDTIHFHTANLGDYVIAELETTHAVSHTFNQSDESWSFAAPLRPDLATGDRDTTSGALSIAIQPGPNSFGIFESPLAPIANVANANLYKVTYRAFTDLPDRLQNPIVRFRASLENFEQTQELVAPSVDVIHGRDAFGPSLSGNDYEQYILAPPHQNGLRMAFDAISPDPIDNSPGTVSLDSARLEFVSADTPKTTVIYYDFRNGQTNGFTLAAPHPTMTPAGFDAAAAPDGLSLRASASNAASILAFDYFGKTEGAARFEGDHLYRVDWTIASHATAENAHSLPGFRLRVNSESFQFAALLDIEPRAAQQTLPLAGAPQTYSLYFKAPAAIDGEAAIFSFDYLTTLEATADSTQPIILQQLSVSEY